MDKIVLDHGELLGFDHPSNLKAKVGDKAQVEQGQEPQAEPDVAR